MSFPFWDWRRSNGEPPVNRSRLDYELGFEEGLKVAESVANWMHGQDRKNAMKHIERMRKSAKVPE